MNITFIGGGNMAAAMLGGLSAHGFDMERIRVVDTSAEKRDQLATKFGIQALDTLDARALESQILVLAIKPQQMRAVCALLAPMLKEHLVISIAAGIRLADLSRWLGGHHQVVRAMPNTPALVSSAMTGLIARPEVDDAQKQKAEIILRSIGSTLWLEDESQMDAITAVSGSGPAYVFYFMEAMQAAAIQLGIPPEQARTLTLETFLGAARLAHQSLEDPSKLRTRVTSKGGTTERALNMMHESGIKLGIERAIEAAAERSRELGILLGKE